jgi:glycosyltransferase involved in cell wall biosynthesis
MISLSIVIPFYNSSEIEKLVTNIIQEVEGIYEYEIIIIDDGSKDSDWKVLKKIFDKNDFVKCFQLTQNYGQHNALIAGIKFAKKDFIATLDDDLQNPPHEIHNILNHLMSSDLDLVYGKPIKPKQTIYRNFLSHLLKSILKRIFRIKNIEGISSYRVFRRKILIETLLNSSGSILLDPLLFWCTGKIGYIFVDHRERKSGNSNYNLKKLIKMAQSMVMTYSVAPLKIATWTGLTVSGLGFVVFCFNVSRYLFFGINVPGYLTVASMIIIFSGTQLIFLGIIGEYLAGIHLKEMRKPAYVVRQSLEKN